MEESVLVIKKEVVDNLLKGNDNPIKIKDENEILDTIDLNFSFMERGIAEKDINYKQIIPYCIINYKDYYFLLQRTKAQTEKRLHNMYSLGIGGHINPEDKTVSGGLYKELNEELYINLNECNLYFYGCINDNSTDVGKVHLGLIFQIDMQKKNVEIKEKHKMTGEWVHKDDLKNYIDKMESWSRIYYENYISVEV